MSITIRMIIIIIKYCKLDTFPWTCHIYCIGGRIITNEKNSLSSVGLPRSFSDLLHLYYVCLFVILCVEPSFSPQCKSCETITQPSYFSKYCSVQFISVAIWRLLVLVTLQKLQNWVDMLAFEIWQLNGLGKELSQNLIADFLFEILQ